MASRPVTQSVAAPADVGVAPSQDEAYRRQGALVPLSGLADLKSGGTPAKGDPRYWGGDIPWLTPKDMSDFRGETQECVTPLAIGNGTRIAPASSVFVAVRGMSLHNEIRVVFASRPMAFNQDIKAIVTTALDPKFLYYVLTAAKPTLLSMVESAGHGTGVLPTGKIAGLPIPQVPQEEQSAIARILGSLDDLIELNRRTNQTLEAMVQATFRDWFVDFGPVRANGVSRNPYLPPQLWSLFPGSLAANGIPSGWEFRPLSELATLSTKAVSPSEEPTATFEHFSIPAFDSGQSPTMELGASIKSNKYIVDSNAVLVSKLNPDNPRVWLPHVETDRPVCSTEFMQFVPKNSAHRLFLFELMRSQAMREEIAKRVTGSTGSRQRAQPAQVAELQFVWPGEEIVSAWTELIGPMALATASAKLETRSLGVARDVLLPALMSGGLRIRDAARFIEEATA